MPDDSPRFHRQLAGLATDWVRAKRRNLERGRPNTKTDSGGTVSQYSFDGQELNRNELRKVRDIRKSGGIVASLFNKKALMRFGGGAELQSDNDDLEEWLGETYQRLDLIVLDLGLDATWFPYGLGEPAVETRSGEFSHVEFVEPWTTLPKTSEYGEILAWEQETQDGSTQVFDPEEIGSIVVNKAAARDKVGVSEVLRNEEEITQYKENQRAVDKAVEIAGFPHHVWTVGAEGRSPVDDNDLRRVRNLIDNMDGDTQFVVGPDVEHDKITPTDFDFQSITKRDLRILTTAIGLPFEVAGYGREGMGSGSETELIGKMHSLENQVARRRFETQFVEEFVRPVVEQYSPYDREEHINLEISPFHDESEDVASLIEKIGDYMSNEEIRDRLDLPPLEDDEIADAYRTPKEIEETEEAPEDAGGGPFGGGDGFFSDGRSLAEIPDNAVAIDSPSEAPEGAQIVEGDQGGLYYVPGAGDGAGEEAGVSDEAVQEATQDLPDEYTGETEELENSVNEMVESGGTYTEAVQAVEESVDGLDTEAQAKIRQQAYINRTQEMEIAGETVSAKPVIDAASRDVRSAAEERLSENVPDEEFSMDYIKDQGDAWFEMEGDTMLNSDTADMWVAVSEETGNTNTPDDATADLEGRTINDAQKEDLMAQKENTEEVLRDMFGESVPVSRGVSGEFADEIRQAKEDGEPVELDHRALESWSTFPDHAEQFAGDDGVIIETEVPVEEVWMSSFTTPGLEEHENEIVVGKEGADAYDPENIHIPDDGGMAELYDVAAERGK